MVNERRLVLGVMVGASCLACVAPTGARGALPPGRSWTSVAHATMPGHTRFMPSGMSLDSLGRPLAYGALVGGIGPDGGCMGWHDTAWVAHWKVGTSISWLRVADDATPGHNPVAWQTAEALFPPPGYARQCLVVSEDLGHAMAPPDTVALVDATTWTFRATATSRCRWVIKPDMRRGLLLFASRDFGPWTERVLASPEDVGVVLGGVAVAALDDTTALVLWSMCFGTDRPSRIHWGLLRGDDWREDVAPFTVGLLPNGLAVRRSPAGGHWVAITDRKPHVLLTRFHDGVWSQPESLTCVYPTPGSYRARLIWMSRDTLAYPVVAWYAEDQRLQSRICVSIPSDDGTYPPGEELATGVALFDVARDVNEDVWVCWGTADTRGMFWTHSVVRATAQDLAVQKEKSRLCLRWSLSEPAPGSWWTVLRSVDGGPFEPVARLRAGATEAMSWLDEGLGARDRKDVGYRLRRDCVDKRYEWLSDPVAWLDRGHRPHLRLASRVPCAPTVEFAIESVPGPLDLELFDIQGRRLLRRTEVIPANGRLSSSLDLRGTQIGGIGNGIYFLRIRDAGAEETIAKVVVLR